MSSHLLKNGLKHVDSRYVSGISNVQIPVLVSKQQSDEEILSRCVLAVREELQRRQENYLYRCISGLDSEERSVESSLDLSLCSQSFSFLSETLPLPIVSDALFSVSREEIESVKDGSFSFLRNISSSSAIPPLPGMPQYASLFLLSFSFDSIKIVHCIYPANVGHVLCVFSLSGKNSFTLCFFSFLCHVYNDTIFIFLVCECPCSLLYVSIYHVNS